MVDFQPHPSFPMAFFVIKWGNLALMLGLTQGACEDDILGLMVLRKFYNSTRNDKYIGRKLSLLHI